jgi:hypothetical protein
MTTDAFGYMEVGRCFTCSNPRHLFAWSGSPVTSERVQCAECWVRVANHFDIEEPNLPTAETFPILGEAHDNCDACQQIFVDGDSRWSRREAVLADQETSVIVHIGCIVNDDCEDSYRPSPFFFGSGKYHFGFELEVEARGNGRFSGATAVQDALGGRVYMKDDASIDDGFEIVTHPHTLENYHKEFDWKFLDKLKREGIAHGILSTCGLHVHVSRTAFGSDDPWALGTPSSNVRSQLILQKQSHELRFMKLIYDNQRQVERISGRTSAHYASFEDKGNLVRKVKYGTQITADSLRSILRTATR